MASILGWMELVYGMGLFAVGFFGVIFFWPTVLMSLLIGLLGGWLVLDARKRITSSSGASTKSAAPPRQAGR